MYPALQTTKQANDKLVTVFAFLILIMLVGDNVNKMSNLIYNLYKMGGSQHFLQDRMCAKAKKQISLCIRTDAKAVLNLRRAQMQSCRKCCGPAQNVAYKQIGLYTEQKKKKKKKKKSKKRRILVDS